MRLSYLTISILVIFGFTSCTKDENPNTVPITKANIIGSVNLYDEGTTQIDNEGMIVKLVGITPIISASTDVNGEFTFLDVPFGTYTLVYEKSGFGTFKKFELDHANNGSSTIISNTPSLGQSSSTQITNLTTSINGNDVILSITTNPAGNTGNTRYIRYYLSTSSDVSDENYMYFSPGLVSQINPKEITFTTNDFSDAGFSSGETIFVKAYGDSFWSNEYDDTDLGRKVFPNLNTTSAEAVSFVIP